MTVQLNGSDVAGIVEGLIWSGSILAALVAGFIIYLMVRPPRHVRDARKAPPAGLDALEAEELRDLVDRMESRLETLERALADREDEHFSAPAANGRLSGRK